MTYDSPPSHITSWEPFTGFLTEALERPLPGDEAQALMGPTPRPPARCAPADARLAAGLLLFYPRDDRPHLLLTVRSRDLPHHRGQVALPGGLVDGSETPVEAALREAHEEVGIPGSAVQVIGELSPLFIPVSGFLIHPFVGVMNDPPAIRINPAEVSAVIETPLADLAGPDHLRTETRRLNGADRRIPYFALGDEKLWGATAMILAELLWILGAAPDHPAD